MRLRISAILLVLLLLPAFVLAQASGTGTVTGRVVDSSGGVLPGVTVTMKSPQALGQFTAVTDAQGLYRIANLAPAAYEARAELQGSYCWLRLHAHRRIRRRPPNLSGMPTTGTTAATTPSGKLRVADIFMGGGNAG